MKQTGILLPVTALPSRHGVGDLGSSAYEWLDLLAEARCAVWQILPLNPTGYGNSPYQPYSSFAGDEIYISLEVLYQEKLLAEAAPACFEGERRVRYDETRAFKETYLRQAFSRFCGRGLDESEEYRQFSAQDWVLPYAVFRAFKRENRGICWNEWPAEQQAWPERRDLDLARYDEEIGYQTFLQYVFYTQWRAVKRYADRKGIRIMGDLPFYVGVDSVDVWAGKKNFLLGADNKPVFIAGVPPDYFSATGQRWGNPIYDWACLKEQGYQFWVDRIGYSQKLFDIIRIDHFRAFDTFWKIPASCPTAVEGEWVEAPGYEVLDTLREKLPGVCLVAEDLGDLRPEVHVLKNHYRLRGMKVLQFTVNTDGKYAFDGFDDVENMIIYTGTHDNATLREWYEGLSAARRRKVRRWLRRAGQKNGPVVRRLISYALESMAEIAILPAFDLTAEGRSARLNTPGTVGSPNWEWRMTGMKGIKKALGEYRGLIVKRALTTAQD